MQGRCVEFAVYRNKPTKVRQYLHSRLPSSPAPPRNITRPAPLLDSHPKHITPGKTNNHMHYRDIHSSLAQLVSPNRRRIATQRNSISQSPSHNYAKRLSNSLPKRPMQLPIDAKNIRKLQADRFILNEDGNNKREYLKLNQSKKELKTLLSNRYEAKRGSKSERAELQRQGSWVERRCLGNSSKDESKDSNRLLNLKPRNKSVYKMSVQVLGQPSSSSAEAQYIDGFVRQKRLGKGGFSQVWSAMQIQTGKRYAIKEMDAFNPYQTHLAEITFSGFFFQGGIPKPEFQKHMGIDGLLTMHGYHVKGDKVYVVYEQCSGSLGECLFEIFEDKRGTQGEKQYRIVHKQLYRQMRRSPCFLKKLVEQLAQSLDLLSNCNIVHSDIKTSNVLINFDGSQRYSFKLVDYGSSFFFQNLHQYRLATPEYIPPELVNFLNKQKGNPYDHELLALTQNYPHISAIDMWGVGCILLEIVHGIPLWLNNKVSIAAKGRDKHGYGLLATENRCYSQILERQLQMIRDLDRLLIEENNTGVAVDNTLRKIIKGCLQLDPALRITPAQVLAELGSPRQ